MQTECLVETDGRGRIAVEIRFLQLIDREVARLCDPSGRYDDEANLEWVPRLEVGGVIYQPWQEAVERRVQVSPPALADLAGRPSVSQQFGFAAGVEIEPIAPPDGPPLGVVVRRSGSVAGTVEIAARRHEENLFQLTVRVANRSVAAGETSTWNEPGLESLVSTHIILGVEGGQFVSAIDPPQQWRAASDGLRQEGAFPILIGDEPDRGMMLASPIILYDYPQVAAESPGDLFDSTEIDEILGLRIMTLTDEEKTEIDSLDARTRAVLERTHLLPDDDRLRLHGTIRGLKPVTE